MSKADEFIESYTRNCSNLVYKDTINGKEFNTYNYWLTPDDARRAVEIAKEEVRKQMLENAIECEVIGIKKSILADSSGSISYGFIEVKGNYKQGDKVRIYVFKEE